MKKSILNIGKALNKAELKTINGGEITFCNNPGGHCDLHHICEPWMGRTGICISVDII
ncbi:hypothetical protein [uncultured Lacinutrix sp.]|uniref:hypothetical protein n=1 Tax=uncultured Lacinutrix sp. TaxID=574032 RepID=UPI00261EA496|nr:hypothetical protein [uncultured Lacinutrix sp.]